MIENMAAAIIIIGGMSFFIAIILGIAGKLLAVDENEKVSEIRSRLPGINCGACGFAGCDALARAIAEGKAREDMCVILKRAGNKKK